jgi:hypothetical protein
MVLWWIAAIAAKQAGPYTDADILNFLANTEVRMRLIQTCEFDSEPK